MCVIVCGMYICGIYVCERVVCVNMVCVCVCPCLGHMPTCKHGEFRDKPPFIISAFYFFVHLLITTSGDRYM